MIPGRRTAKTKVTTLNRPFQEARVKSDTEADELKGPNIHSFILFVFFLHWPQFRWNLTLNISPSVTSPPPPAPLTLG